MSKKALIVWGGWNGHTPQQSAELFAPFLKEKGYEVEIATTLDVYTDEGKMSALSLIVPIWTMGQITGPQESGLMKAVAAGVGLAGFHGGIIDSFRANTEYQFMTGGQWVAHPGNVIPSYKVAITDRRHPITAGLSDFEMKDTEQYYIHVDPGNHVLCTTTFSGEHRPGSHPAGVVMPYAWTRQWHAGKVFVAAWGHTFKDFDTPQAKTIVERGMLWASK